MSRWLRLWAAVSLVFGLGVLSGCDNGGGDGGVVVPPPASTATVSGTVTARDSGSPVAGARVQVGSLAAVTTGADGRYSVSNVPNGDRVALRVDATGYAPTLQVLAVASPTTTAPPLALYAEGVTVQVNPTVAVEVNEPGSGARLAAPANAFRRVDGGAAPTGNVAVSITSVDPTQDPTRMPGDYTAGSGSTVQAIESFGAVAVDVRDAAGNRYNLAPGVQATLRIPAGSRADTLPQTVGLYSLNETTGRWVQEGTATLAGSGSQRWYEATITHLSWWNADQPLETIQVRGCVRTPAGQPASGRTVSTVGFDYTGYASAASNAQGDFVVPMKRGGVASLQVSGGATTPLPQLVGPSQVDIVLPNCLVERAAATDPPSIVRQPQSANTTAGGFVQFSVLADGTPPLVYQWQRDGVDIAGARTSVLTVFAQAGDNQARYRVVVRNAQGTVTSNEALLTVLVPPPTPPTVVVAPQALTVAAGNPASFSVVATGTAPLAYQWLRDGQPITGATASSYSFAAALADSGARFSVTVSNGAGSVTSAQALLTVQAGGGTLTPTISVGPVSTSVPVGGTAVFTVLANGSPPLAYQWRRNGANIAGQTQATLSVTATQADNGARYSVVVSNAAGSVTSNDAVLTVAATGGVSGTLTVTGTADASVLGTFTPTPAFPGNNSSVAGPSCLGSGAGQLCSSTITILALEVSTPTNGTSRVELLSISITSSSNTPPGPQPGAAPITLVVVAYAVSNQDGNAVGFGASCPAIGTNSCDGFPISVNPAARTITFKNARLLLDTTNPNVWVELNGTLTY
jgi:hypothetical protein